MVLGGRSEQLGQIKPFAPQFDFPTTDTGEVEEVFQQPAHPLDLADENVVTAIHDLHVRGPLSKHLNDVADRRQGGPQFMAQEGQKLVLAGAGRLGLGEGRMLAGQGLGQGLLRAPAG